MTTFSALAVAVTLPTSHYVKFNFGKDRLLSAESRALIDDLFNSCNSVYIRLLPNTFGQIIRVRLLECPSAELNGLYYDFMGEPDQSEARSLFPRSWSLNGQIRGYRCLLTNQPDSIILTAQSQTGKNLTPIALLVIQGRSHAQVLVKPKELERRLKQPIDHDIDCKQLL